jgi:hypothetical protein
MDEVAVRSDQLQSHIVVGNGFVHHFKKSQNTNITQQEYQCRFLK